MHPLTDDHETYAIWFNSGAAEMFELSHQREIPSNTLLCLHRAIPTTLPEPCPADHPYQDDHLWQFLGFLFVPTSPNLHPDQQPYAAAIPPDEEYKAQTAPGNQAPTTAMRAQLNLLKDFWHMLYKPTLPHNHLVMEKPAPNATWRPRCGCIAKELDEEQRHHLEHGRTLTDDNGQQLRLHHLA